MRKKYIEEACLCRDIKMNKYQLWLSLFSRENSCRFNLQFKSCDILVHARRLAQINWEWFLSERIKEIGYLLLGGVNFDQEGTKDFLKEVEVWSIPGTHYSEKLS